METATATVAVGGAVDGVSKLVATLRERAEAKARCLASLRPFSGALFRELTRLLDTLRAQGINEGGEPTTTPLSDGLATLTFEWEGSRVIVSPVPLALAPPPESSAANALGGGPCGRIVVFLQPRAVRDEASPIHEIFVSPHGRFVTHGLGYPGIGDLSDAEIAGLAAGLLHRLTFEVKRWHRPLDGTTFDFVSKGVKEPIGFAPPTRAPDV